MLYCWQMKDRDGDWGIIARFGPIGESPMITPSLDVAEQMRPIAEHVARTNGCLVRLVRYLTVEVMP
jgi:hypothetical protein